MSSSKDSIAIGASWCGYSQRQKAALERDCGSQGGAWDAESSMCTFEGNRKVGIVMCDVDKDAEICQQVQGQVSGYPTWVEKDSHGDVTLMKQAVPERVIPAQERTVHYVPGICSLPSMKEASQCQ